MATKKIAPIIRHRGAVPTRSLKLGGPSLLWARRACHTRRSGRWGSTKKLKEQRMPFVSIRSRLIFLAALLLATLAIASALLIGQLMRASDDLAEQAKLVSSVKNANSASKHFGDLKYWITDSAKTLFVRSQQNADAAKARLDLDLKAIAPVDPAGVAAIGGEVDKLTELARKAPEAYSSHDSAGGDALMQQAQSHILNVDREIEQIGVDGRRTLIDSRGPSSGAAKFCSSASSGCGGRTGK